MLSKVSLAMSLLGVTSTLAVDTFSMEHFKVSAPKFSAMKNRRLQDDEEGDFKDISTQCISQDDYCPGCFLGLTPLVADTTCEAAADDPHSALGDFEACDGHSANVAAIAYGADLDDATEIAMCTALQSSLLMTKCGMTLPLEQTIYAMLNNPSDECVLLNTTYFNWYLSGEYEAYNSSAPVEEVSLFHADDNTYPLYAGTFNAIVGAANLPDVSTLLGLYMLTPVDLVAPQMVNKTGTALTNASFAFGNETAGALASATYCTEAMVGAMIAADPNVSVEDAVAILMAPAGDAQNEAAENVLTNIYMDNCTTDGFTALYTYMGLSAPLDNAYHTAFIADFSLGLMEVDSSQTEDQIVATCFNVTGMPGDEQYAVGVLSSDTYDDSSVIDAATLFGTLSISCLEETALSLGADANGTAVIESLQGTLISDLLTVDSTFLTTACQGDNDCSIFAVTALSCVTLKLSDVSTFLFGAASCAETVSIAVNTTTTGAVAAFGEGVGVCVATEGATFVASLTTLPNVAAQCVAEKIGATINSLIANEALLQMAVVGAQAATGDTYSGGIVALSGVTDISSLQANGFTQADMEQLSDSMPTIYDICDSHSITFASKPPVLTLAAAPTVAATSAPTGPTLPPTEEQLSASNQMYPSITLFFIIASLCLLNM